MNLLDHASDVYSQNGEDGVIGAIFDVVGTRTRWCCEFGAWDGIHFSNTRRLVENGWSAVLVEADDARYAELVANNAQFPGVHTYKALVGVDETLEALLERAGAPELDLLVIDIDGLDHEILAGLDIRPRVISVEVNAGHAPTNATAIPRERAAENVGQPFSVIHASARQLGYRLVAYTGNAIYVRSDADGVSDLPDLMPAEAYGAFLDRLDGSSRRWLYHVNLGHVPPFFGFDNPLLGRDALGLGGYRGVGVQARYLPQRLGASVRRRARGRSGTRVAPPLER